jgi:hypothetical protein
MRQYEQGRLPIRNRCTAQAPQRSRAILQRAKLSGALNNKYLE